MKQKYPKDTVGETLIRLKRDGHLVVRDNIQLSRIDLENIFGEVQSIVVNSLADSGEGSLRQAVAEAEPSAIIVFDEETFKKPQTIVLNTPIKILLKPLTIQGPGVDKLFLNGAESSSIFTIATNIPVNLSDMTLLEGFNSSSGGAIRNAGNFIVKTCQFYRKQIPRFGRSH